MNLMDENFTLKEEIQCSGKEKERSKKKCRCILEENDQLKVQIKELLANLEILDKDKAKRLDNYKEKMDALANDNKKFMDEMMALNQENRNLLKTIDDLKNRLNLTVNVTQDEVVNLNKTIQDLQDTLQRTKQLQEEEEKVKNADIDRLNNLVSELRRCLTNSEKKDIKKTQEIQHLNKVIIQLVGNLKEIEEKMESGGKICRICRGRAKVGFSENMKVQTEPDGEQRELLQQRDDIIQIQSETLSAMECRLNTMDCKETIDELNEALKKRDDVIKLQNDTLSAIQQELETTKRLQEEAKLDNERCLDEIKTLKNNVNELQCALEDSSRRALDLQQVLSERDEMILLQTHTLEKFQSELTNLKELYGYIWEQIGPFKCMESKIEADQQSCLREMRHQFSKLQSKLENITEESDNLIFTLEKKDQIIQLRSDALKSLELDLRSLRDNECELKMEKARYVDEVKRLKGEINQLNLISQDADGRANNFQGAVDLYLNTINVLEASVEKYKMEINQQKETIANLQEALLIAKKELDVTKQKTGESVSVGWATKWFSSGDSKLTDSESAVHDV